jgi:hypothetical protein
MFARSLVGVLAVVTTCVSCSDSPTAPTRQPLTVTVTPNPLRLPAPGEPLIYNVRIVAPSDIGVRLDRAETRVTGPDGRTYLLGYSYMSRSAGCGSCSDDYTLRRGEPSTWERRAFFVNGEPRAGVFEYTVWGVDDNGEPVEARTSVPVE